MAQAIFRFLILFVFFFSGSASLIYQVAWQRALTLHYGVGSVSVAIVVSLFLLGLGLGALVGGWMAERVKARVLLYVLIELGIGACGLASLYLFSGFLPVLATFSLVTGFFVIFSLLIVPTILMGMTLPLVLKILNAANQDAGHSLSILYFLNTLGAAFGALSSAYVLISFFGISGAVATAAVLNLLLGVVVLLAYAVGKTRSAESEIENADTPDLENIGFRHDWQNYAAVFTTGFLAIGYQMVWFRFLTILLKPSAYVFSTVLGVYLLGIALGSYWMSRKIKSLHKSKGHKDLFFTLNAGISVVIIATFGLLYWAGDLGPVKWLLDTTFGAQLHPPYHPVYAIKGETLGEQLSSLYLLVDVVIWPILIVLPATFLMGASFPLISAMTIEASKTESWKAGTLYGVNILGNVLGALITGFFLFPIFGTEITLLVFVAIGLLWILGLETFRGKLLTFRNKAITTLAAIVIAVVGLPGKEELYLTMHGEKAGQKTILTEGVDSVVVSYHKPEAKQDWSLVYINGASHARFPAAAYRLEVMEAVRHAETIESALVIGFGGGDITNTLMMMPELKKITVVEISGALKKNLDQIKFYERIFGDERMNFVVEDGRRFLHTTDEKYDVVMMDPLRSTTAYSNNLYSKEFFQLVSSRMNPKGVLMTWFNEYRVIPNTLAATFDHMQCFYYFCLSSRSPMVDNQERYQTLFNNFDTTMQNAVNRRRDKDYYDKGNRDDVVKRQGDGQINTDMQPNTEYYIGYNLKRYFRWVN
jgi:spermidine synthase